MSADNSARPEAFRKKPVVIDAMRWTGDNAAEVGAWIAGRTVTDWNDDSLPCAWDADNAEMVIVTLEGDMTATAGDWIIRGVKGEFYPCKPDIFNATYEPADGEGPVAPEDTDPFAADLRAMQLAVAEFAAKAWPDLTVEVEALALAEEVGELARCVVKRHHGNRGTAADWTAELRREMGDVLLVLCNLAVLEGVDLFGAGSERLAVILTRDLDHDLVAAVADQGETDA